jgi:hypothetical protein
MGVKPQRPSTIAAAKVHSERQRFPVPYGLFIALGIYALLVLGYVWATYWNSPGYQAARHYEDAVAILGVDDGRTIPRPKLEEAFVHLVEVGRLIPQERWIHERIEAIRWRFDERHFKLSEDLKMRAETVSMMHEKIRSGREHEFMVVSERERGWAPDQLLAGPKTAVLWAIPGALIICVVGAWWTYGPKRVKALEHEEELQRKEEEVKELGAFRRRGPDEPKKPPPKRG